MAATLQRGHIIQDEGTALTQRSVLDFTGPGVTATDAGGKTVVDVQGGAPSGLAGGVLAGTYPNPSFSADMTTQAELEAWRLDEVAAPTSDVSLNAQKIIGLGTPTASTEAANKAYVDAIASGFDVKLSVRAATTANITLSGAQTIDGVSIIATNRVLVKNQTAAETNGIYVAAAGAWARSTDADTDAEVTAGLFTFVEEGATYADQGWALATNNPIVLGTTPLSFTQVSGVGGAPTGAAGGVLSGTYPNPGFAADMATQAELNTAAATAASDLAAHTADATAAHAASAIAFTPDGSIAATTVQLAIQEVRDEAGAGASVNDQTISTTDNTVNNLSTTKHGWAPKATNNTSHYLAGNGVFAHLQGITQNEWYVDAGAPAGGDGRSHRGAVRTFAEAIGSAVPRDIIYICSDLNEDVNITVADVRVIGVGGHRIINGSGSSSIAARTVRVGFGAHHASVENLWIRGHANFKGVHLCLDVADQVRIRNIRIDGTAGTTNPTMYAYASPASPYTPAAGTGIGGIGVLFHQSEHASIENLEIGNCSIAIGLGTWTTQNSLTHVKLDNNWQHLVEGLHSGPNGAPARTTACGWSQNGVANSHVGDNTFINWQAVAGLSTAVFPDATTCPLMDLIGDGTTNYNGDQGGGSTYINVLMDESGAPTWRRVRVGSRGNTFVNCTVPGSCKWDIEGQHNIFNTQGITGLITYSSDFNTFNDPNITAGWINGTGSYAFFRNANFVYNSAATFALSHTGIANEFRNCLFSATGGTQATVINLGLAATCHWSLASGSKPTYGTTVTTSLRYGSGFFIDVTNTSAFTMANPHDDTSSPDNSKIMCNHPISYDIKNSSGGVMGTITWGSKFKLAGAFTNPASTKRRTISFVYEPLEDIWVETSRSAADVG